MVWCGVLWTNIANIGSTREREREGEGEGEGEGECHTGNIRGFIFIVLISALTSTDGT